MDPSSFLATIQTAGGEMEWGYFLGTLRAPTDHHLNTTSSPLQSLYTRVVTGDGSLINQ